MIRVGRDTDLPRIVEFVGACYQALAVRDQYTSLELEGVLRLCASAESLGKDFREATNLVVVWDGVVVGVVMILKDEMIQLFVAPEAQGRGIGKELVRAAEEVIRRAGYKVARVQTASAPGYYPKLGFVVLQTNICDRGPLQGRVLTWLEKHVG